MKSNIKLSIIISLKNNKLGLSKTLESIKNQDIKPYMLEVIIIDCNSKDHPFKIIENFKKDLDINWVSRYDNNIYNAWNFGLNLSTGTHICFIGSGDLFLKNSIKILLENIDISIKYQIVTSKTLMRLKNGKEFISGKKCVYEEFFFIMEILMKIMDLLVITNFY